MKISKQVMTFAEDSPELYAAFKDYKDHYQAAYYNAKGKVFSEDFSLEEKEKTINALYFEEISKRSGLTLKDFNNSIERFCKFPTVETFANDIRDYLIDMILPETIIQSIGVLADIRTGDWGDTFSFDIENNALFTVTQAGYRQRDIPAQQNFGTTVTLAPVNHMVTVKVDLPAVLRGTESIAKFTMKAVKSIETQLYYDIYDTFTNAMENATTPTELKMANYTETGLISLCQKVSAWNAGRKPIIMGTAVALKSVLPSENNTRILLQDEFNTTLGHMRTFNGYDVIEMEQVADYTSSEYALKLDDTKVFVVSPSSDKLIKVALGGTLSHTSGTYDKANLSQFSTINKAWEVACISNSIAGVITLA